MLRAIMSAIRSAMRRLAKLVWVTVEVGGRLVSMLRIEPEFEHDVADVGQAQPAPANTQAQVPAASDLDRVRDLATSLARRPDMPASEIVQAGVAPVTAAWLSGMSPTMLVRVALASDGDLADAIAGRRNLRGVYPHNEMRPGDARRAIEEGFELDAEMSQHHAFA